MTEDQGFTETVVGRRNMGSSPPYPYPYTPYNPHVCFVLTVSGAEMQS